MSDNEKDPQIKIVATCDKCGLPTNRLSSGEGEVCSECGLSKDDGITSEKSSSVSNPEAETTDNQFIDVKDSKRKSKLDKTAQWLEEELPGRYNLKSIIFKCSDYVALKVFDPLLKKDFLLKIFKNPTEGGLESSDLALAELLSGLDHPHILPVYESGLTSGARLFLLMEYPGETTLESVIKEDGFLDMPVALEIFAQTADALHTFHQLNIPHGAMRPRSITVQEISKGVVIAKLTNYSITKITEDNLDQPTKIGRNYTCIDAFYMSPEECNSLDSDLHSEIYSFGCVMFHAMTGKPVFRARNLKEAVKQHTDDTKARFRRQYEIPENIQEVVLKMLDKDPETRYPDFEKVLKDILVLQSGQKPKGDNFWEKIISVVKNEQKKKRF